MEIGLGDISDILLDESSRLDILESAWRVLMRKDRRLVDVFLDIVGSWYGLEDLRSELFMRGWLVMDYARGDRGAHVNYIYSVMVNHLRTLVRYWRRRRESGFREDSDLESVGYRLVGDIDPFELLRSRELEMMRLRLGYCECKLREVSLEAYESYRSRVDGLADEILSDISVVSRAVLSNEVGRSCIGTDDDDDWLDGGDSDGEL